MTINEEITKIYGELKVIDHILHALLQSKEKEEGQELTYRMLGILVSYTETVMSSVNKLLTSINK